MLDSAQRVQWTREKVAPYRMVEGNGVDDHELSQVVLVGGVVAVPGHDVEGAVALLGLEQVALVLGRDRVAGVHLAVLEPRRRRKEVARVGQSVGACVQTSRQSRLRVEESCRIGFQ